MADLSITAADVRIVESSRQLRTRIAGATITAGMVLRTDTAGKVVGADGSAAGTADVVGVAITGGAANLPITVAPANALVNVGNALSALAYGAPVYLSDTGTNTGTMADAAGTATLIVGYVEQSENASTPDKLLRINSALGR